jgi:long-chain fatty acid transport protein
MGGASTAAPIDALGALYWNPASISGLENSELEFGVDMIYSEHEISSSFGPFSGATDSDNGVFPVPSVGWVHHTENPAVTLGLAVSSVAGLKTNVISDPTNLVLAPQPVGLGRISTEAAFMEVNPVISVALSDNFSVGAGPIVAMGQVALEPFVFDAPNLNGYPAGRSTRYHWGGGVQVGAYYITDANWHFGASVKSPIWFETFRYFSQDAVGLPRVLHKDVELPMIVSLGTSYSGIPDWIFAADLRFLDYHNADGFGEPTTFGANGALAGIGWDSVFAVALGVQRRLTDSLYVRAGYTWNDSPIDDVDSFFNMASPLMYEHMLSGGASIQLCDCVAFNVAYSYLFESEVTGPIVLPGLGPIPGSSVTNQMDAHFGSFGVTALY